MKRTVLSLLILKASGGWCKLYKNERILSSNCNKLGREPWRNCPKGLLSRVSRYCVKIMSGFLSYDFFSIIFYIYTMGVLK